MCFQYDNECVQLLLLGCVCCLNSSITLFLRSAVFSEMQTIIDQLIFNPFPNKIIHNSLLFSIPFFVFALLFFSKFCCCLQEDIFLLIRVKTVVVYLVVLKRRTFSHENIPQYKQIIYLLNKYGSINSNKIVIIISKSKFIDKFLFTYTLTLYWIHTYFLIFYLSRPNYCFKKVSFY